MSPPRPLVRSACRVRGAFGGGDTGTSLEFPPTGRARYMICRQHTSGRCSGRSGGGGNICSVVVVGAFGGDGGCVGVPVVVSVLYRRQLYCRVCGCSGGGSRATGGSDAGAWSVPLSVVFVIIE